MNCSDWDQDSAEFVEHLKVCEHCREFERNAAAMRELTIAPAAFAAVRQRVLSEIQVRKRRTMWWTWSAVAAAACIAIVCVSYFLPLRNPATPTAVVARIYPPEIGLAPKPVVRRVRHKSSGRSLAQAAPVRKTEPLAVVKMLTDDPNVIIIWLVDQKGDSL
jgi:predicted anti-sigma-YlaC factor YlaD